MMDKKKILFILFLVVLFIILFYTIIKKQDLNEVSGLSNRELILEDTVIENYPLKNTNSNFLFNTTLKAEKITYDKKTISFFDTLFEKIYEEETLLLRSKSVFYSVDSKSSELNGITIKDSKRKLILFSESGYSENDKLIYLQGITAYIGKNEIYGTEGIIDIENKTLNVREPKTIIRDKEGLFNNVY